MYFRVSMKGCSLAYYAQAPDRAVAVKKVERLSGPLPPKEIVVKQINQSDVPEGETVL